MKLYVVLFIFLAMCYMYTENVYLHAHVYTILTCKVYNDQKPAKKKKDIQASSIYAFTFDRLDCDFSLITMAGHLPIYQLSISVHTCLTDFKRNGSIYM